MRDRSVLAALAGDGSLSFQGLRRLLGFHPQILIRILRRLAAAGLVMETPEGYRLVAPPQLGPGGVLLALPVQQSATLFSLLLADAGLAEKLRLALAGRWFGNLRWLGQARMGETRVLAWLIEPEGTVLRLVIDGRDVRVEVADEARDEPPVHDGVRTLLPAVAMAIAPIKPTVGARLLLA